MFTIHPLTLGILIHFAGKFSPNQTEAITLEEAENEPFDDEEEEWRGLKNIGGD